MRPEDLALGLNVQRLLDSTIRPLLNVDAGDIEVTSVVDGRVTLTLLGGCSRCVFRLSCASYTVLDRMQERFADRDATFEVANAPVAPRTTGRGAPDSLRSAQASPAAEPASSV
ncbi:NifU family protein [Streptomyces sp. NPDC056716]|uniref:NifU family protein n=1 Tax=unclassified Streptomyces TaxID=2593676 RepID=UPI0036A12A45